MNPFDEYDVADANEEHLQVLLSKLPPVMVKTSWRNQISLQLRITPWYFYICFIILTYWCVKQLSNYHSIYDRQKLFISLGIYIIAIVLLMLSEIMRSSCFHCEEIERSCRFNYAQILFTRIVTFAFILIVVAGLFAISTSNLFEITFIHQYALILFLIASSFLLSETLFILMKIKDYRVLLGLQMVTSFILLMVGMPYLMAFSQNNVFFLLMISCILLYFMTKKSWRELKNNETFSNEFD